MRRIIVITAMLAVAISLSGCPKKPAIVTEEGKAPAVDLKAEAEAKAKAEAEARAKKDAEEKARTEADTRTKAETEAKTKAEADARAREEAEAKSGTEAKATDVAGFGDIHFDFDMFEIKGNDKEILSSLAEWLLKNKGVKLQIEGHADDRGNSAYNLALGERRAYSAKEYLVTLGINAARISTISYGQEKPVCTEPSEECWWKNRRAHFVLQDQK